MRDLEPSRTSTVPVSAAESSPANWVKPAAVLPLLERIERLPEDATGALMLGTGAHNHGIVLIERGRICWAVSSEMKRRLVDLLCHQAEPALSKSSIESIYNDCRSLNKPLGECLVDSGLITERGLWRALRQHTAEAIAVIAGKLVPSDIEFQHHKRQRYDARFTYSTTEVLVTLGALRDQSTATLARTELKRCVPESGRGAAYTRDRDGAGIIPIGEVGTGDVASEAFMDMGAWATSALDVAAAVTSEVRALTGTTPEGQSIVAWSDAGIIYAVLCPTLRSYARLVSSLARRTSARS
ncbi:MAG TPA: hypothetical protein VFU02_01730 [Polyangiaceae bacterium]|nr:hypothetical protein [Polyangiaceae bacterium]